MPTQVDAHVLLAKSWDARLIAEWASLGSEYAMLTTYTMPYDDIDKVDQIPHICKCVPLHPECASASGSCALLPSAALPIRCGRLNAVRCRVWFEVSSPADVEVCVTASHSASGLSGGRLFGLLALTMACARRWYRRATYTKLGGIGAHTCRTSRTSGRGSTRPPSGLGSDSLGRRASPLAA